MIGKRISKHIESTFFLSQNRSLEQKMKKILKMSVYSVGFHPVLTYQALFTYIAIACLCGSQPFISVNLLEKYLNIIVFYL